VAIVTFANQPQVISPLTDDRASLLASVDSIDGEGSTRVWDALKFTLSNVVAPKNSNRRTAVVIMTDGVDNALSSRSGGSGTLFSDLLEIVRANDALIVPIYLDTEHSFNFNLLKRIYENARNTLKLLADESGGLYYLAQQLEDLQGLYGQVVEDLGKIYSLGYRPDNQEHDGSWRQVEIQIPGHPELKARARPGYYAK
jgi:VWFA-related protein